METFTSESNETIVANTQVILTTVVVIIVDCFGIGLIIYCMRKMYLGIEIGHPIYATLFCNLVTVLAVCITEILILPFLKNIRFETFVKSSAAYYGVFQGVILLVLSVLRYLYICHNVWLHEHFPNISYLTALSVGSIYMVYSICMANILPVYIHHGWPFKGMTDMDLHPRLVCAGTLVLNETVILVLSSIFYFLILSHRGGIGKNSVDVLPDGTNKHDHQMVSNIKYFTK